MATFKLEIQNKRKDGTYNIRIRLTHNRQIRRLSTNLFVTSEDLTKGLKLKNERIAEQGNELIKKCRTACNDLGSEIVSMPIDALTEKMRLVLEGGEVFRLDFIQFAEGAIKEMSPGNAMIYRSAINILRRFISRDNLDIAEINTGFLERFEAYIEAEPSKRGANRKEGDATKGKGSRAVSLYLSRIRALYKLAKKKYNDPDRNIINIPYSPFENFKIKGTPATRKRAIDKELIQAIIDLPYKGDGRNTYNLAKDCFLLSFMFMGMNSADLYDLPPHKYMQVIYNRKKTATRREDLAEMRIHVEPCAGAFLEKYKDPKGEYMFDFPRYYSNFKSFNKAINKGLKKIGEDIGVEGLTFYAARHSWATIARSRQVGIDKATVHEALNHVDKEMRITDIYIDKDWSVIWEANKKVLALFDWSDYDMSLGE